MRRVRASASIFSSAWKFSSRMRRTTSRALVSSRTSASFRPTSRLTTASAIRPATSSRRGMPEETAYTAPRGGVKHNYPENRSKVAVHLGQKQPESRALAGKAVHLDPPAVRLGQGLHEAQPEPEPAGTRRVWVRHAHVLLEDPGQLLGRNSHPVVLDRHLDHARPIRGRARRHEH